MEKCEREGEKLKLLLRREKVWVGPIFFTPIASFTF
jgi:hypothetical protein